MRLFALQGSERLGTAVASALAVELDALEEREFADGEHKSRPLVSVRGEDVYVLHSLHGPGGQSAADRLMRLLFFVATCRENGAARVTAVTPYLAVMRKDQQTKPRDPVTSRYVAQLFDAVGTDMVVTLDVHNVAAFQNAFRRGSTLLSMLTSFVELIEQRSEDGKVVFLSPDSGGMRREHLLREAYVAATGKPARLAMMEKHRSDDLVTGDLFAGDVEGADVFVFDDIISTGSTMVRAARACKERGAQRVRAIATHGLLTTASEVLYAPEIDSVLVSDTVALPFESGAFGKLEVISCSKLLAEAIARLHSGGSIHRLVAPFE
jgi:ribose-phosphate pyrophosphokinase